MALVLDASLPPLDKVKLAPALLKGVQSDQPRIGLRRAIAAQRGRFQGSDLVISKVQYMTDTKVRASAAKILKNRHSMMKRLAG